MASVPELAICYHENGVVRSYELLKTDDIFLLKGVSEDGTPAFHPYVVQQNGLSVLRFLQANCKQDPGAYWVESCLFYECLVSCLNARSLITVVCLFLLLISLTNCFSSCIKVLEKM